MIPVCRRSFQLFTRKRARTNDVLRVHSNLIHGNQRRRGDTRMRKPVAPNVPNTPDRTDTHGVIPVFMKKTVMLQGLKPAYCILLSGGPHLLRMPPSPTKLNNSIIHYPPRVSKLVPHISEAVYRLRLMQAGVTSF